MTHSSNVSRRLALSVLIVVFSTLSAFAQSWPTWSTSSDIRNGARGRMTGSVTDIGSGSRFQIAPDGGASGTVSVTGDSLDTQYIGFSDSNTSSDTLTGSSGFTRLRVGDRVEIRGSGTSNRGIAAEQITLLGRQLSSRPSSTSQLGANQIEGVVRQVSTDGARLTLENDSRRMFTVTGTTQTPVYYRGQTYEMRNIEVGDRIRVDVDSTASGNVRARSIDVISSVTDVAASPNDGRRVTSLYGRVTRVDARSESFRIDTSRERDIRIDAKVATDEAGRAFRIAAIRVGDVVEVTGDYDSANLFRASTVRYGDTVQRDEDRDRDREDRFPTLGGTGTTEPAGEYVTVILYGSVSEVLREGETLGFRDSATGKTLRLMIDGDFAVRTKNGNYVNASSLKSGDQIAIKAFRDPSGRTIAQTVRYR
ncbi:MAG TPA: DUF5666 domain-containing protein [Thermoanaerobaculia bacterium]|nr:DUF5666 domain-containing protein [Thermoanaerobaculia bacterium]